jgi:hypothetical protein
MLLLLMMAFGLTDEEHDGSDASGNDDSGSDSSDSESDFAGSSDSDGQAKKRKLKPMTRRGNKGQKAARKQKKSQKAAKKQRNRATRAAAGAAPAAASAPANDGYSCGACDTGACSPYARGEKRSACCAGHRRQTLGFSSTRSLGRNICRPTREREAPAATDT